MPWIEHSPFIKPKAYQSLLLVLDSRTLTSFISCLSALRTSYSCQPVDLLSHTFPITHYRIFLHSCITLSSSLTIALALIRISVLSLQYSALGIQNHVHRLGYMCLLTLFVHVKVNALLINIIVHERKLGRAQHTIQRYHQNPSPMKR